MGQRMATVRTVRAPAGRARRAPFGGTKGLGRAAAPRERPLRAVADPKSGPPSPDVSGFVDRVVEAAPDLSVLAMRVGAAALTPHHGLDKLGNAQGFAEFVVAKHLGFLPYPLLWTCVSPPTQPPVDSDAATPAR